MSRLTDYSKFDHVGESSSENEEGEEEKIQSLPADMASPGKIKSLSQLKPAPSNPQTQPAQATAGLPPPKPVGLIMRKNPNNGRYIYEYNGSPVYEWEQKLEDVTIYIPAPPVPSQEIHCQIYPHHLELGVKSLVQSQKQYFLNEETFGLVDVSESTWYLEDATTLIVYLAKAKKGEVWELALKGNTTVKAESRNSKQSLQMDPLSKREIQKEMMLERFQEENPGMDFRGAEFNGSVPDPRTFMGGVKYS